MKKGFLKIVFLVTILFISVTNVNAETSGSVYNTSNGISYTINSFNINIYDGSTGEYDIPNYFNGNKNLLYTIPVSLEDEIISYEPEETVSNSDGSTGSYIDLNLNVDSDDIERLVKTQIPNISNNTSYYAELVVNYNITEVPSTYKSIYHLNILESAFSLFSKGIEDVELNTQTSQTLEVAKYSKENDVEEFITGVDVLSSIEGNESNDTYVNTSMGMMDYLTLSDTDNFEDTNTSVNSYILMLHNSDLVTEAILDEENNTSIDNNTTTENQNEPTEIVKTGNTSMSVPTVIYIASSLFAIIGIGFIVVSKSKWI